MAAAVLGAAFIPYFNHLIEILETNKELKKTALGILRQVAWGAGGTVVGGCLGGPPGALVGGITGAVIGYAVGDEYQSLVKTLKNLTDDEKRRIVDKVQDVVGSTGIEALTRFVGFQAQREILINILQKATKEMRGG
ncbi:protein C19orf12 homolog [Gigantopelta aegis]|uniref:protein C19orf12 homolog n=1 Tax=Gigantopelta aegis TaxID=1735272 RepID=UPI001B888E02|nr:protein C19orf12 homolog [Gigantopelta aegis]XP_041368777.1 protein C19orf12 homolog [Gigantopelta aegis]XP_041368778.1 protein C19orf12 homolog [Gigantopelta aegis]XP_041368779.1 protein C19orf12 homolog [Gigantopelta aegis]